MKGKLNKVSRGARITAMLAVACGLSFATALQAQTIEQGRPTKRDRRELERTQQGWQRWSASIDDA